MISSIIRVLHEGVSPIEVCAPPSKLHPQLEMKSFLKNDPPHSLKIEATYQEIIPRKKKKLKYINHH